MKDLIKMSKKEFLKDCVKNDVKGSEFDNLKYGIQDVLEVDISNDEFIDMLPEPIIDKLYYSTVDIMKNTLENIAKIDTNSLRTIHIITIFDYEYRQ